MIIKLDEKTLDSFLPMIPDNIADRMSEGGVYCLGSVRDDTAVGILIFSLRDGVDKNGEPVMMIVVYWVCTAEDYRRQGVADELMDALMDVTGDNTEYVMICSIPENEEISVSEAFFRKRGFEIEKKDIPIMEITKDDCRQQIKEVDKEQALSLAGGQKRPKGIVSLDEISKLRFRKMIKRMLEDEEYTYYSNLTDDRDAYDRDTSYAIIKGDEISSVVLFRLVRSNELHMVMLDGTPDAEPKEMLSLLHYSAGKYYLDKPEDMKVTLTLWKEKSRKLAEHIFPHKNVYMVRRGYLTGDQR